MAPKFTDRTRFRLPYADAHATGQPGYLAARMKLYADLLAEDARKSNVKPMGKKRVA